MGVLRSTDDGGSWGSLIDVTAQDGGYNEASLIELPDTSVAMFIRQDVTPSPIVRSGSADAGLSWSGISSLGFNTNPGLPAAILAPDGASILLYYRQLGSSATVYRFSADSGASWSHEFGWSNSVYVYAGGYRLAAANDSVESVVAIELSATRADVLFESYAFA
jgi:hypothetical protein